MVNVETLLCARHMLDEMLEPNSCELVSTLYFQTDNQLFDNMPLRHRHEIGHDFAESEDA